MANSNGGLITEGSLEETTLSLNSIPIINLEFLIADAIYMSAVVENRLKHTSSNREIIGEVVAPPVVSILTEVAECLGDNNAGSLYFVGSATVLISDVGNKVSGRRPAADSNRDDIFDLDFEAFDYDQESSEVVVRPVDASYVYTRLEDLGCTEIDSRNLRFDGSNRNNIKGYILHFRDLQFPSSLSHESELFIRNIHSGLGVLVHSDISGNFNGLDLYYPFSLNKSNKTGERSADFGDRKPLIQVRIPRRYDEKYCPAAAINLERYPVFRFTPDGLEPFSFGDLPDKTATPVDFAKLLYKACVVLGKFPIGIEEAKELSTKLNGIELPKNVRNIIAKRFWHAINEFPSLWNDPSNLAVVRVIFPQLYSVFMMTDIVIPTNGVSEQAKLCDHLARLEPNFLNNDNPILSLARYIGAIEAASGSGTITPTRIGQIHDFLKRSTYHYQCQ